MYILDQIIDLYARQAELQARSGVGGYLSAAERAELEYIPTLLSKAWERRRMEKLRCGYQSEAEYKRAKRGETSTMHRTDTRKDQVYDALQSYGTATSTELAAALGTMSANHINSYLMRLLDEGLVIREDAHDIPGSKYIWRVAEVELMAA